MLTYRDILKWGDKREEKVDENTLKVIREKFELSDEQLKGAYLRGDSEVKLEKAPALSDKVLIAVRKIVGDDNVATDDNQRATHAFGKYYTDLLYLRQGRIPTPPDAVVYPRSHDDVEALVKLCNDQKIPLVPFGGNSSVTRGLETVNGGISMDLTKHLNRVISVNETNMSVCVQAGMFGPAFEEYLNNYGQKYTCGHFPQSFEYSTVGGWAVTKGAGQASTGYGKMEDMVLSMKVVTPRGTIETKDYPRSAQGWDLNHTFMGSEGTLGVITEVTMRIHKLMPNNTAFASFVFKSFEDAVRAMRQSIQGEFGKPHLFRISDPNETDVAFKTKGYDDNFSDKVLNYLGYKSGKRVLMFVSVEGDSDYTALVIKKIRKVAKKNHALYIGESATKKWLEQRYASAYLRDPLMDMGIMTDTLESAVSWQNLIPLWKAAHDYVNSRANTFMMVHISHVYENGANLYFTFLGPMKQGKEMDEYREFHKGLVDTIAANQGSLSHHHGVGRVLSPWMEQQHGTNNLALMQAVKNHLDPNNIMNPGGMLGLK